jgi:hypothetical protein
MNTTTNIDSKCHLSKPNINTLLKIIVDCLRLSNLINTIEIKKYEKAIKNISNDLYCNNHGFEIQDIFNDFKFVINSKEYFEHNRDQMIKEIEIYQAFCRKCFYEHDFYIDADIYFQWYLNVITEKESIESILEDIESYSNTKAIEDEKMPLKSCDDDIPLEQPKEVIEQKPVDCSVSEPNDSTPNLKHMTAEEIYIKMSKEMEELKVSFKQALENNELMFRNLLQANSNEFNNVLNKNINDSKRQFIDLNRKITFQEKQIESISEYLIIGFLRETVSHIFDPLWALLGKEDLNTNNLNDIPLFRLLEYLYPDLKKLIELMIQIKFEGNDIIHLTKNIGNKNDIGINTNQVDSFVKFTEDFITDKKYNLGKFYGVKINEMKEFCFLINGGDYLNFKRRINVNDIKNRIYEIAKVNNIEGEFKGLFDEWSKESYVYVNKRGKL